MNLICNFLYNANKIDKDMKFGLQIALNELLINAIEHGNCAISYEEKSRWLENNSTISDLIKERTQNPDIAMKKVTFEYTISPDNSKFLIADEGEGFNWRELKDASNPENLLELHGRGIMMTKNLTHNLVYNDKGNVVSFEIGYNNQETITPGLFRNMKFRDINKGEILFEEGQPSNFLYYIVSGLYNVIVNNKIISTLTADDIFMGEMSFLLNNRRSATVQAQTDGKLIKVSKLEFITAIKKKPHYALFLSRLLAQRIQRSNTMQ